MPATHPVTHGSIAADWSYTIIMVHSCGIRYTAASVNPTTATSNSCFPIFVILPFLVLIICVFFLIGRSFSDDVIVWFSLTSIMIVWRGKKCLTQSFTLQRLQVWICEIRLPPIYHQQICQATTEPVTGFFQYGLSLLSLCYNVPPCCSV